MSNELLKYWNVAYRLNDASFSVYKSGRTNAAMVGSFIIVHHKITNEGYRLNDNEVMKQFVSTLDSIITRCTPGNIWVGCWVFYYKNVEYKNMNERVNDIENVHLQFNKQHFNTIYALIHFIFSIYCIIYPHNEISYEYGILKNESVQHIINKYLEALQ